MGKPEDKGLREEVAQALLRALSDFPVLSGRLTIEQCRHATDAALPALSREGWRPTHRHVKSGGYYQVLGRGKDITNHRDDAGVEVVVYRGVGGHLWVREASEFDDGRFEPLPEDLSASRSLDSSAQAPSKGVAE